MCFEAKKWQINNIDNTKILYLCTKKPQKIVLLQPNTTQQYFLNRPVSIVHCLPIFLYRYSVANLMSKEILAKYNLLDKDAQKEVQDFLDFLLFKKNRGILFDLDGYRRKIQGVSTWSAADIEVFDENAKLLNQWQIEKW